MAKHTIILEVITQLYITSLLWFNSLLNILNIIFNNF